MKLNTFQTALTLVLLVLSSCKKDAQVSVDLGYDYYPAEKGKWLVYDVDSIVHNAFTGKTDTFQFQIKEVFESEFKDNEDRVSWRIERYKRADDSEKWKIKQVWYTTPTKRRVELIEGNIRYMKLSFPVKEGEKWNGNAFNTFEDEEYKYMEAHQSLKLNGLSFDSTVTVLQIDNENLIEKQFVQEKYAKNTGLIYKEIIDLDYQNDSGLEFFMVINAFGKTNQE